MDIHLLVIVPVMIQHIGVAFNLNHLGNFYFFLNTFYFLINFKNFRCRARLRTKSNGKQLEIVEREHNHKILTERRKKGALKALNDKMKKE